MMPTPEFWIRLPFACLIIIGIWTLFQPGMLLAPIGDYFHGKIPTWMEKPLWDCPPCMSSIHGTWIWFFTGGSWFFYLPFILALCGLNRIVSKKLL